MKTVELLVFNKFEIVRHFSLYRGRENERFTIHKNLILAFILRHITLFIYYYENMGEKDFSMVSFVTFSDLKVILHVTN